MLPTCVHADAGGVGAFCAGATVISTALLTAPGGMLMSVPSLRVTSPPSVPIERRRPPSGTLLAPASGGPPASGGAGGAEHAVASTSEASKRRMPGEYTGRLLARGVFCATAT